MSGSRRRSRSFELLGKDFVYPRPHPINETRFQRFKEACNEEIREIVQKIRDNTIHVSFEEFITKFEMNICKIINKYFQFNLQESERPIYIKIKDRDQNKSNYWLLLYFINYVYLKYPTIKIQVIMTDKLEYEPSNRDIYLIKKNIIPYQNNDIILLIDDCIYTGQQMKKEVVKINNVFLNSTEVDNINIFILCSYISDLSIQKELNTIINILPDVKKCKKGGGGKRKNKEINFSINGDNTYIEIPIIEKFLSFSELYLLNEYYGGNVYLFNQEEDGYENEPEDNDEDKTNIFSFNERFLIYFDHKLADYVSTIPIFYSGVVLNDKNRQILRYNYYKKYTEFEKIDGDNPPPPYQNFETGSDDLDVIEFIENCDGTYSTIRTIDINSPNCPYPPYKIT
jgi:hypothetical protein